MRSWSLGLGRILGVEIRIHIFFVLLLGASMAIAVASGVSAGRGLALWLLLLLAVVLREIARAIAAAWHGLELRSILLLPTGGLMSFSSPDATERANDAAVQKQLAMVGPITNIGVGLMLGALIYAITPPSAGINLLDRPWITPAHVLRSAVWMQLLLGAVNLLPAFPLDGGRVLQGEFARAQRRGTSGISRSVRAAAGFGHFIAYGLMVSGLLTQNLWLLIMGAFVLIAAHIENQGMLLQTGVDAVTMRDVMLTEYSTIPASDTIEDALTRSANSLQDVFPVVRGQDLVGAVSRQLLVDTMQTDGNGYVQGIMTRSFPTASPGDSLVITLKRIMGGRGAPLVPVIDGERIVGIITPQNLAHAMGQLSQRKRPVPEAE